jgi:sulfopyruvate decarboxylase TPP-binding subunit
LTASLPDRPPRPHLANARTLYEGILSAGIDLTVYLPDSGNYLLQRFARDDPKMRSVSVTREDEGLAIAMGAFMGGRTPCLIMESSGMGLCYMALAWLGFQQRMAALLISSHSSGLGEHVDYHGVTRHVVDPLITAMGVPHYMARDAAEGALMIREATMTVRGQILPVSIQLPRRILWED